MVENDKSPAVPEDVVLVHGIWLGAWSLIPLARRLRRCGFRVHRFGYPSVRGPLARNAQSLRAYCSRLPGPRAHIVAHSLGGLVACEMLSGPHGLPPARLVALGTPFAGSRVAASLGRHAAGRRLLGQAHGPLVAGADHPIDTRWEIGVIAGTLGAGVGRLLSRALPRPHDGTVAAVETELGAACARLALPVSHTALLFSKRAARAVCAFLASGRFPAAQVGAAEGGC